MLLDFRTVASGTTLETDLCIIGGGAAGITIAVELIGSPIRVCLVESGGFEYDDNLQSLYEGEILGLPYYELDSIRLRFFGGTTNHWLGLCPPLDKIDFETRPWVPFSGWPISRATLDSYYERAGPILNLGPVLYGERGWDLLRVAPLPLNPEKVLTSFSQTSRPVARLGSKFRQEVQQADNVQLLYNANVINIQTNDTAATVDYVDIATLDGNRSQLRAKQFILACGGLENPRLLLLSNKVEPAGIGNRHGLVGRFFMEHLHTEVARIFSDNYFDLQDTYLESWIYDHPYKPSLRLGVATQKKEQVLNSAAKLRVIPKADSGVEATRQLYNKVRRGKKMDDLSGAIWRIVKDFDEVAYNAYRHFVLGKSVVYPAEVLYLLSYGEQAPNPDSRVVLSHTKDALGMNRIALDWRMTELERRSLTMLATTIGAELGRLNAGRVRMSDWLLEGVESWGDNLWGGGHHMGTTRMADDPQFGVVDRNCRVHGIHNLYIAGSSVFATSGWANPTLTIVALALRLADHIKAQFV